MQLAFCMVLDSIEELYVLMVCVGIGHCASGIAGKSNLSLDSGEKIECFVIYFKVERCYVT